MSLILASNSQIRREMLVAAGVEHEVRPPEFDEDQVKAAGLLGEDLARRLAEGKAASIDEGPDVWVIGSDSTISVDGQPVEVVTTGRHDPCVGIRAVPIAEAMLALVLMDHWLRHRAQNADVRSTTPVIA